MKNIKVANLDETCENILLNQKLDDVFQFLLSKAMNHPNKKVSVCFSYINVEFEINCNIHPERIVPRGYENVQE